MSNEKNARYDVHIHLKALTKQVKRNGGINIERQLGGGESVDEALIAGVEKQWHSFWTECGDNPSRVFLDYLNWKELNILPSITNTVLIMRLILPILQKVDFKGSNTACLLEEKTDAYTEKYVNDPGPNFNLLYLLDRFVGKIANKNKVAFQAMACILDGIVYEKMSSQKPSQAQCCHLVMIEHIANIASVTEVSKIAQSTVKGLSVERRRLTKREALRQSVQPRHESIVTSIVSTFADNTVTAIDRVHS